ncbi:MAG: hypothetical protein KBT11_04150 [Treponema sp.]|nr:hypothetical protein [Candidatus Treponema equifaecale]
MANGIEDLKEKNSEQKKVAEPRYNDWKNFQGREDAEMLHEKSTGWSAFKNSRGDYDYDYDD